MTPQDINNQLMLRVGTILHGTYRIDSYLSSGGFGNTYIATNIEFDEKYAIKEFFMRGVTQRDDNQTSVSISNSENIDSFLAQREKFKKEARRLRQLNNPHIVKVYDLFDENGTSYYVMDYIDGVNLDERLKLTGRAMTEKEVNMILPQILDALKYVHDAGMWHLDLKPANIMLERGGNIKLIDFGASKQLNAQKGGATTSTAITYTNGYAPREQMEQNYDKFGPWTDIYALGATLYTLLSNRRPPLPTDIDDDITTDKHEVLPLPDGVSPETKSMLLSMLNTNRTKRPQSILALDSYKSKDEEPFRDLKLQTTPKSIIDNDEEATVIAKLQSNKEEKKVEHKPGAEHEHRAASQTSNTYTSQSQINNDNETLNKGIISGLMIVAFVIIVIIILNNYGGSGNYVQDANAGVANIELNDDNVATDTPTQKNGYFEETYDDGSSYKGNFKNGLYSGHGTFTWANGDKFEGEFKEGVRIKGTYTWPEKRKGYMYKYEGEFKNNELEGKGTAYYVGGETESGIWKNGKYMGSKAEQNLTFLEQKVVGNHLFSLQWIESKYYGTCKIKKEGNTLKCVALHESDNKEDYLRMEGNITIVSDSHLKFSGSIIRKVHNLYNGQEYRRDGTFDFKAWGNRKYWRGQNMDTPDGYDYIDIFFEKY